jgi:serine/threonine protein phosphatase PrpC
MSPRFSFVRALASNRPKSEDAAEVFERGETLILVLADGAGGMRGGAMASGALVAAVRAAVADPVFAVEDVQYWADLFRVVDVALAKNMVGETTGVVVVLGSRKLIGVGTGDSEAWVLRATEVDDLTRGQHTKQRLGSGRVEPAVFERAALSGTLVVATDGLFKYAAPDVIARIVRASAIRSAAEELIALVRLRSGTLADDVALVLVAAAPTSSDGD